MEALQASEARRFGKYTLVAKLATGGMAEIFLARLHGDGGFEKLVCIKRILPHLAKDPQFVAMFLDEARVAARISHPNVCQVFELGEWNKQYYIAMEYLEGVPLAVFRRKDIYTVPPDPRLVAGFGVQACEGLHHAHQLKRPDGELLGVVHRDISPQNLFATTDGVVKVLDFGIAKVQDASVRTSTGAVKGTYAYMAPEQLRNEKLDRRVDVWAIGAVLWETLAQTHLFKRDTEFLTFEAITKLPIPNICDVRPDVPPLLGDTISRALSRNPDDRFASARALGEALGQAVGPLGGALTPPGISEEVAQSFETALAEQRTLLRIAREGGQFDLESSSPLVGHGTRMSTTPVSNIQRRAQEAQQEVAQFVAAKNAIDSLVDDFDDDASDRRRARAGSDGAFTPAPSRTSRAHEVATADLDDYTESSPLNIQRRSSQMEAQWDPSERRSRPMAAQRRSAPYAVAPARFDETEPPIAQRTTSHPPMPAKVSRLPWVIALISLAAAVSTGVLLYMKLSEQKQAAPPPVQEQKTPAVVMNESPPTPTEPANPIANDGANDPAATATDVTPKVGSAQAEPSEPPKTGGTEPPEPIIEKVEKIEPAAAPKIEKVAKKVEKKPPPVQPKIEKKVEKKPPEPVVQPTKVEKKPPEPVVPPTKVEPVKAVAGPPGSITIDSAPVYAVIFIDGKKYGETPLVNIKLAPGKHAVRAVSPSGATKNLTITIEAGKTAPVRKISW